MLYEKETEKIIGAFYKVYNSLGFGFLEKVYENAMILELKGLEFDFKNQQKLNVFYNGEIVEEYFADIIIEDSIILELKTAKDLGKEHEAQLLNYLKATKIEVGLLLNFGKKPKFKRMIFTQNSMKRE